MLVCVCDERKMYGKGEKQNACSVHLAVTLDRQNAEAHRRCDATVTDPYPGKIWWTFVPYIPDGRTDGRICRICALHCMLTAMKNIYIYTPIFKYTPPFFTRFKSFATLCKLRDPQLRVVRCPNPAPIFCALAFFSAV